PEFRDAIAQHAAELMEGLEDGDGKTLGRQQIGVDEAGGTRADDRDRRLLGLGPRADKTLQGLAGPTGLGELGALGQEPFELADLDRPSGQRADALALQFLRADAAGDVRQRIAALDELQRLGELARPQKMQHFRNMDLDRAAALGLAARPRHADLAGAVFALLVAQRLEPHQQIDLAGAVAEIHVTEIALIDELEVPRPLLGRTDVWWNAVLPGPALRQALEHRIAVRKIGVDRGDELALELERDVPDEAQEDGAHVVVAQQQAPQRFGEVAAELVLLELPDDGLHAVVDEHLPERFRAVQEPTTQQAELFLEDLERFGVLELLDLAPGRLERPAHLPIALEIAGFGARGGAREGRAVSAHG